MAHITIPDTTPYIQYTVGSASTTDFTIPFAYFADADIVVYVDSALQTITTDYTIAGTAVDEGYSGGTVTLTSGVTNVTVTVYRDVGVARTTDFPTNGPFNITQLNTELDTITAQIGQNETAATRAIHQSWSDTATDMELPAAATRATYALGFDANGDVAVTSSTIAEIDGAVGAALGSGVLATSYQFTGDGSTVAFTITGAITDIPNEQSVIVDIDGITQHTDTYTASGTTVTFTTAPPDNSDIQVRYNAYLGDATTAQGVTYNQGGTGAQSRTVENKLQESVSVKDFGAVGDGTTDDTAAIQAAIDANTQSVIYFPSGTYKITSTIQLDTNVFLQGEVYNFSGTQIVPYDCAAFKIDGDLVDGGFAFNIRIKDMFINCTNVTNAQDYIIYLNDAYRCNLENIRIQNVTVSSSHVAAIVKVRGTNYVNRLKEVYAIGAGNTGSGSGFDINVGKGNLVLQHCDSENVNRGFLISMNSQVDIISPYCERAGQSIRIEPATLTSNGQPQLNVFGGFVDLPSSGSSGVIFNGTFNKDEIINFYGFRVGSNDHSTKKTAFNTGGLTWSNDNRININGFDWSWVSKPDGLRTAAYITPDNPYLNTAQNKEEHIFKITSLADNTATDVFKIEGMTTGSPYPPVYLKVRVYESFNGWGRALEESVFLIQDRSAQSAFTTTKQSIASVQEADSANFSITTLEISATENSDNVTFSVTSDFNTAILSTMSEVYFYVTMVGTGKLTLL